MNTNAAFTQPPAATTPASPGSELDTLNQMIRELSQEERSKVQVCYETLRRIVSSNDQAGLLAFAKLGLEVSEKE